MWLPVSKRAVTGFPSIKSLSSLTLPISLIQGSGCKIFSWGLVLLLAGLLDEDSELIVWVCMDDG